MADPPPLMHATQVARAFHTPGWVYEEKYDGWRMLAVKEAGGVRLVSRNGRDHTTRFHAIAEALAALKPKTFTLDGEVDLLHGRKYFTAATRGWWRRTRSHLTRLDVRSSG
jgi:ATP-dependent DNA ligase